MADERSCRCSKAPHLLHHNGHTCTHTSCGVNTMQLYCVLRVRRETPDRYICYSRKLLYQARTWHHASGCCRRAYNAYMGAIMAPPLDTHMHHALLPVASTASGCDTASVTASCCHSTIVMPSWLILSRIMCNAHVLHHHGEHAHKTIGGSDATPTKHPRRHETLGPVSQVCACLYIAV